VLYSEASRYLVEILESVSEVELEDVIERILDGVKKQPLSSSMVELLVAEAAVQDCSQSCDETIDNVFNIIGAFDVPRFIYSTERKKFILSDCSTAPDVLKMVCSEINISQVYWIQFIFLSLSSLFFIFCVSKRIHRHELFTPPVVGLVAEEGKLKTVEAPLGSTVKLGEVIVLGMITQLKEGKFFLEDLTGSVHFVIYWIQNILFLHFLVSHQFHSGLYMESSFVLAEGWYEDSVSHVSAFGFPPIEPSSTTRAYYGHVNFFGGPSTIAVKASAKLKQLEEENEDAMFVIISDLWLDSVKVLEKIQTMFSGYSTMPPTCFIFCGNFSSALYGKNQIKSLKEFLKAHADLICEHPNIHSSSRFVFVPGPEDPGPSSILPRPPLAEHITEDFRQRVPFSVFTTNLCRIQNCSQEIVVIREVILVNKMCRNCLRLPGTNLDIPTHFVKSILSQGHLMPLPLYVSPVYWAYDYALHLYPVPDVVIFADKYDPFSISNSDCLCINPGSFPRSGFSFKVYYPSNRTAED
ncbi:DNA polymerase epsilon subunit 2, partial [Silurus meridionalis]